MGAEREGTRCAVSAATEEKNVSSLRTYLEEDHRHIASLLARSTEGGSVDREVFEAMRRRLLRHIGIEEKIVLAAARAARGGVPIERARRLRVEHGAIASLLVPTPDLALIEELRGLLARHEPLEEEEGGVYDECDRILGASVDELAARARDYPEVPLATAFDGQNTVRTADDALRGAARMRFGTSSDE